MTDSSASSTFYYFAFNAFVTLGVFGYLLYMSGAGKFLGETMTEMSKTYNDQYLMDEDNDEPTKMRKDD